MFSPSAFPLSSGELFAVIRVSNLKDFKVSVGDILEAGKRDGVPKLLTDGVHLPVRSVSLRGSLGIVVMDEDVTKLVGGFKMGLGVEWELLLPKERFSPIVDPVTGLRESFSRSFAASVALHS